MSAGTDDANRKLIRPRREDFPHWPGTRPPRGRRSVSARDETGAEATHYQKQVQLGTALAVTLEDGTVLRGTLQWYDRDCLKLRLPDGAGVLVYKRAVLHTAREGGPVAPGRRGSSRT